MTMTKSQPFNDDDQLIIHHQTSQQQEIIDSTTCSTATTTGNCTNSEQQPKSWPSLPPWAHQSFRLQWGQTLNILEWDDNNCSNTTTSVSNTNLDGGGPSTTQDATEYRLANGWKGNDLIHSQSSAVRVLEYRLCHDIPKNILPSSFTEVSEQVPILTGIVHFTPKAESHKGYCHGGSMCSVFDDIIGWTGFCATGKCIPWSGYTVQVNTKLCKPIQVHSILKVVCFIEKIERRKVWVRAFLFDPNIIRSSADGEILHAEGEGLVILNKAVMEEH